MNKNDIITASGINTALNGKANTSHTHAIADVTNLQSSLNNLQTEIQGLKVTKVWENPNPSQDIGETDFTISQEIPEMVIQYRIYKGNSITDFIHISGGTSVTLRHTSVTLSSVAQYYRSIIYTISNGTTAFSIRHGSREQYGASSTETNNSWLIPVAIYAVGNIYNS